MWFVHYGVRWMQMLNPKERQFLLDHEVCVLATSVDGQPHAAPVCYVLADDAIWIATDYYTKKYRNILKNPKVAVTVFEYHPSSGIVIEGKAEVVDEGPEFQRIYTLFYEKFDWVRRDPWGEKQTPFIKVKPKRISSWIK